MSKYKITLKPGEYSRDYVVRRKCWEFFFIPYITWDFVASAGTFEEAVKIIERDKQEQQIKKIKPSTWYIK